MKPVAIFRVSESEGPGYFATALDAHRIPWALVKIDQGEPAPREPGGFSGLAFMGGPMSVNDPLPWVGELLELVRAAVRGHIPVLGHCLGGQLIAKALGGVVSPNPVKEIGWGRVAVAQGAQAGRWFGGVREFLAFHWHGERFTVPPGTEAIASSAHCAHQAFALGPHLALQCHVEMTSDLVAAWCRDWEREVASLATRVASVQTPQEMQRDLPARLAALHAVADRLYAHWITGLKP